MLIAYPRTNKGRRQRRRLLLTQTARADTPIAITCGRIPENKAQPSTPCTSCPVRNTGTIPHRRPAASPRQVRSTLADLRRYTDGGP